MAAALLKPKVNITRKNGRRMLDAVEGFSSSVGKGICFKGEFSGEGHLIVLGQVEGNCRIQGTLVIAEGGSWQGDINAIDVVVAGKVQGNINVENKIEVLSSAEIKGTITTKALAIAEGAVHEGQVCVVSGTPVKTFTDQREEGSSY